MELPYGFSRAVNLQRNARRSFVEAAAVQGQLRLKDEPVMHGTGRAKANAHMLMVGQRKVQPAVFCIQLSQAGHHRIFVYGNELGSKQTAIGDLYDSPARLGSWLGVPAGRPATDSTSCNQRSAGGGHHATGHKES